jgi:large subunit ribosomal protein L29
MSDKKIMVKDLENLSIKDLVLERTKLRKRLFSLKMSHQARALKQTHLIKIARRNIARVNTVLSNKTRKQK